MYSCKNSKCANFDTVCNPGGIITIKDGKSQFSGSKCKICGLEMESISNQMPNILSINNPSDGRNL